MTPLLLAILNIPTCALGTYAGHRLHAWIEHRRALAAHLDAHDIRWRWYERNRTLLSRLVEVRVKQTMDPHVWSSERGWN